MRAALRAILKANISADEILSLWMKRGTAQPSQAQQNAYGRFVTTLVQAKLWHKLDLFYLIGASDQTLSKQNMVNDRFTLTEVNAPTWAADRGYTFNGTTQELTTGWSALNNGQAISRDSCHVMAYSRTDGTTTGYDFGEATGTILGVRARVGTNGTVRVMDSASLAATAGGAQPVHILGNRDFSHGTRTMWRDGAQIVTAGGTSVAMTTNTFSFGHAISLFSDRQVLMGSVGAGFGADEIPIFYNACHDLAVAIGADT